MNKQSVEVISSYLFVKVVNEGEEPLVWEELLCRGKKLDAVRGESSAEFLQINAHMIPQECTGHYIVFLNAQKKSRAGPRVLALALKYTRGKKECVRRWLTVGTRTWGKNILLPKAT